MANQIEKFDDTSISLIQRFVGYGTILLGVFALYYCVSYIGDLWDTPKRTVAIGVTASSVAVILFGVAIGFPEFLPRKTVSLIMLTFGLITAGIGSAIAAWLAVNILAARQPQFSNGDPTIAIVMVSLGIGIAYKCYSNLAKRSNTDPADSRNGTFAE